MLLKTLARRNGYIHLQNVVRLCSTNVCPKEFQFKPKFSQQDEQKILNIVNDSSTEELARFDVTLGRIKNLEHWRSKNGPFRSVHEILEVEGLGENVLQKLCQSILIDQPVFNQVNPVKPPTSKSKRQLLSPPITSDIANKLTSAVSIHLAPTGVSWAKLSCEQNQLSFWNFIDFSSVPNKLSPTDTFEMAVKIVNKLPVGDIYVMESSPTKGPQSGKQPIPTYTQQLELSSMLLALLNTTPRHRLTNRTNSNNPDSVYQNKVYYLRSHLPARLFRTLVGNERVAATGIIKSLLDNSSALPCSPITMEEWVRSQYYGQNTLQRDIMGQALLLVISFMDLCIYQTPSSLAAISPGRKEPKK